MNTWKKLGANVLDLTKFAGHPSLKLAAVVHRETEAQRARELRALQEQHGPAQPPLNALMSSFDPEYWCRTKSWWEYAKDLSVLERCSNELELPVGEVARKIAMELDPGNAEAMYWMGTWLLTLDEKTDIEFQLKVRQSEIRVAQEARSKSAREAARALHEPHAKAKAYVRADWALHKEKFKGNRTAFAKNYVEVIQEEFQISVAQRTISADWLKGI